MKTQLYLLILLPIIALATPFHNQKQIKAISSSVVKIYTASSKADYYRPWQKKGNTSSSGTGVVIADHLILTAAHVVSDGTFIQVKKSNDAKKYTATVKWIAHEADLALLEVEEEKFFEGTEAQTFGGLPYRQDGVVVYGYPVGGDEISTTKGIVSRIEHQMYSHSYMDHLTIQIDAPINPGNSGGPAFDSKGKIVGIAIQTLNNADGIGYLVPVEVITHFFTDIKDGRYDGYPTDGISIQYLQNKNIKAFYDMGKRDGVLVTHVQKNSSADGYVQKGDIILETDGISIAGDNTIKLEGNGRVASNYLVRKHQIGDLFNVKLIRDAKEMEIAFPLKKSASKVAVEHEIEPRYYLFGGMVFMPLTVNYLKNWGAKWLTESPSDLMYAALHQEKLDKDIKELVVLSNILPNDENANYGLLRDIVKEVNGERILSLDGFVKSIKESKDQYINILLESGMKLILDKEKALKSDMETMKKYGIGQKEKL